MDVEPLYKLIVVGSLVASLSSLTVQKLLRPYIEERIRSHLREHALRFAPVAVNLVFTAVSLPALLRLVELAVEPADVVALTFIFGIAGGAGAKLAFDFWRARVILRRDSK